MKNSQIFYQNIIIDTANLSYVENGTPKQRFNKLVSNVRKYIGSGPQNLEFCLTYNQLKKHVPNFQSKLVELFPTSKVIFNVVDMRTIEEYDRNLKTDFDDLLVLERAAHYYYLNLNYVIASKDRYRNEIKDNRKLRFCYSQNKKIYEVSFMCGSHISRTLRY